MYRIYRLFEYFLTFRNKKLLPETIIDNLLSDSESDDPKNMLRTQIFRLRKTINSFIPENEDASKYLNLNFTNGYYSLEIGENTAIDVDEFEKFIQAGNKEKGHNVESAIENYQNAINLYKGLYLSDKAYEVWLVPTRNYYQRLFIKTLYNFIELLKKNGENERIISLCEESLLIEPFEENIHIELMDALRRTGQNKSAIQHYEYSSNMLEKELGIKPTRKFINFINKIQNNQEDDLDVASIEKSFQSNFSEGAIYCSIEDFKFLFDIQRRKSKRNNQNDYLCIIDVVSGEKGHTVDISSVLEKILRNGDIFTVMNENQILILLHNISNDLDNEKIRERLMINLFNHAKMNKDQLQITFRPLSDDSLLEGH